MLGLTRPKSAWEPPSVLWAMLDSPVNFTARALYVFSLLLRPQPRPGPRGIRVVCIGDTHDLQKPIPDGDLLIHAGDLTNAGTPADLQKQIDWLETLPHTHKVAIAGNHDTWLDARSRATLRIADQQAAVDWKGIQYLQHSSVTLTFPAHGGRRLVVFGAPQIPACGGREMAFQYTRHQDAWTDTLPQHVDVLVTHTPPRWHLDLPAGLGCEWLLREIWRVRPRLHVWGHIHGQPGVRSVWWDEGQAAYERICERNVGLLGLAVNPLVWLDFAILIAAGLKNTAWTTLWGGQTPRAGVMVNAAQFVDASKQLDSSPKVVVI